MVFPVVVVELVMLFAGGGAVVLTNVVISRVTSVVFVLFVFVV